MYFKQKLSPNILEEKRTPPIQVHFLLFMMSAVHNKKLKSTKFMKNHTTNIQGEQKTLS